MSTTIFFVVLSVLSVVECNSNNNNNNNSNVSAFNLNNDRISFLLETLIHKVDMLEDNMNKIHSEVEDVNTVVSKVEFQVLFRTRMGVVLVYLVLMMGGKLGRETNLAKNMHKNGRDSGIFWTSENIFFNF